MRLKGGTVGLALVVAMLVAAPAASASTASMRGGTSGTVVYQGDSAADAVTLWRVEYSGTEYYLVTDTGGITAGDGCFLAAIGEPDTTAACPVSLALNRYELSTGGGDDTVDITGPTAGGSTALGQGADRFTGLDSGTAADSVLGGDGVDRIDGGAGADPLTGGTGNDSLTGGAGDDRLAGSSGNDSLSGGAGNDRLDGDRDADVLSGGSGNDVVAGGDGADHAAGDEGNDVVGGGPGDDEVAGQAGNDSVNGDSGDDALEFGAEDAAPGIGAGADDLRGGDGVDRLSYNDHPTAITLTLDGQPGDGSAGEGDNVHDDIETVIGTTLDDVLSGDDLGQDLYGHAGRDTIDGGGGDDLLNGGTGEDVIRGGTGDDALEGSADGDFLDGGPGRDLFEGDNECAAEPCTGGSDDIRARDGEQDTVNCGVGADTATVDAVDIVALDAQQGCESIDRAAAVATPPFVAAAQLPSMRVRGGRGLRTLLRRGLRVDVTCPAACRIRGRLILGHKVVAGARRTRITGAVTRLRLKANKAGKRRLKHRTKARMTLVLDVTDSAGAKTTLARPLTFKVTKKKKTSKKR